MNVVFVEPSFPPTQRHFVRALSDVGATVIGLGGMFVRSKTPPPPGSVIKLVFVCTSVSIESECTVRHITDNGMGIEFTGITPDNEEKLKNLLHQLRV